MKTEELTGRALDYAVALAEDLKPYFQFHGVKLVYTTGVFLDKHKKFAETFIVPEYSKFQSGDDIIDREFIDTYSEWEGGETPSNWRAECVGGFHWATGTTRREAAMRAYVASKLGDEIEIPKELE